MSSTPSKTIRLGNGIIYSRATSQSCHCLKYPELLTSHLANAGVGSCVVKYRSEQDYHVRDPLKFVPEVWVKHAADQAVLAVCYDDCLLVAAHCRLQTGHCCLGDKQHRVQHNISDATGSTPDELRYKKRVHTVWLCIFYLQRQLSLYCAMT